MRPWFKRLFGAKDPQSLSDRLDDMETAMKRLQEDWTDTYGKFRILQMRVAKQVQRIEQAPAAEEPGGSSEVGTTAAGSLTPRQSQVQEQIMRRRNRVIGG